MYRRIRDLREDKDLLQKDLAAYLQCSQVCSGFVCGAQRVVPPREDRREGAISQEPAVKNRLFP